LIAARSLHEAIHECSRIDLEHPASKRAEARLGTNALLVEMGECDCDHVLAELARLSHRARAFEREAVVPDPDTHRV
jgi:hypothetical protein